MPPLATAHVSAAPAQISKSKVGEMLLFFLVSEVGPFPYAAMPPDFLVPEDGQLLLPPDVASVAYEDAGDPHLPLYQAPLLQNVVATAGFGDSLDLKKISVFCKGDFDMRRFAAASLRIDEPKSTSLVFGSGKIVCTGSKTVNGALLALERYYRLLATHVDPRLHCVDVNIQNMVAKAGFGYRVDLQRFADAHSLAAVYDALFPGLRYKMANPKLMILIFESGRVVITGAKRWDEICAGWDKIRLITRPFQQVPADMDAE